MVDHLSKEARSRVMSRIRGQDTKPELMVRSALHSAGFRFRLHRRDLPGRPDIVLPRYRTVIFVHGCFWHGHSCSRGKLPASNRDFWTKKIGRNKQRDAANCVVLQRLGWNVIVMWECVLTESLPSTIQYLSRAKISMEL